MIFEKLIAVLLLLHDISAQWQIPNQITQQQYLFNPMATNPPATFQQKMIQIRQRIERPQPRQQLQQRSYFPRITAEDGDEGDDEEAPEDVDIMQPRIQQQRIVPLKTHRLLPVIIGMVPTACGSKMYFPRNQFCYKNRPYSRDKYGACGPRLYRKESHFCFNGQTFNKIRKGICGNGIYDKLTQICLNHRVRNICAGEIFDPSTHFCYERIYNREFYSMCGKRVYKKSSHYCVGGKIYVKRKAVSHFDAIYTPADLSLWGRSIQRQYYQNKKQAKMFPPYRRSNFHTWRSLPLNRVNVNGDRKNLVPQKSNLMTCGFEKYEPKSNFCYKGKVAKRCGGAIAYNPTNLLCFRDFLYTKSLYDMCGNEMFNKFSQSCINGHVLQRDRKQFEKLFMDYGSNSERDRKEQQEIYNLSKQLETKRREFRERHQQQQQQRQQQQQQRLQQQQQQQQQQQRSLCNLGMKFNKRSHFCYNGKLYNRSINAVCGGVLYNKTSQRCLGGQLFPTMDLNKPAYYLGGGSDVNDNAMNAYNFG